MLHQYSTLQLRLWKIYEKDYNMKNIFEFNNSFILWCIKLSFNDWWVTFSSFYSSIIHVQVLISYLLQSNKAINHLYLRSLYFLLQRWDRKIATCYASWTMKKEVIICCDRQDQAVLTRQRLSTQSVYSEDLEESECDWTVCNQWLQAVHTFCKWWWILWIWWNKSVVNKLGNTILIVNCINHSMIMSIIAQ